MRSQLDGIFSAYEENTLEPGRCTTVRVLSMSRLAEHVGKPLQYVREQAKRRGWEFMSPTCAGNERWCIRRSNRDE